MKSTDIRRQFIEFFVQKHGHTFVPSSSVVPHDDPTLLFTNAGMNQFKPIFLGTEKRAYTRAANTQKCIRAGGKHNDLDDVGRSRRHHTFFEMLGNWSFGDYFKQGAIEISWELLTKVWKLDPTRLHVSCFEGDEKNGVPRDTEAADIWRKVANWEQYGHKSDDHIHYFGKDNFWEMGDTGPCGPCTEIYYDRTEDKSGGPLVNGEDPRVMEIWNNVFIQYNRNTDRTLVTLPAQHVDTGMGFERITQVLQNADSNYSIDLWDPFWEALKKLSGHTYGGKFPKTNSVDAAAEAADPGLRKDIAFRVIGDHIRCLTFALTDGAIPSNEGRGYVLRRILRRAVRFGRQQLELKEPFLHTLVAVVIDSMGDAFPELMKNPKRVSDLIHDEEVSFGRTLDRGIALFEDAAQSQIANKKSQISAEDAFKLHDTYGFPIDLTRIMAEERGMSVDVAGYEKLMEEAREKARAGGKGGDSAVYELPPAALAELQKLGAKPTDDLAKYASEPIQAKVVGIWNGSNLDPSADTSADQEVGIILDRTNFYAEMGGQVGDSGTIQTSTPSPRTLGEGKGEGQIAQFDVETTRIFGGYVLHVGRVRSGTLKVGDTVTATLAPSRKPIMQNHTGTHLANWALREVLGDDVQQKGSLVDPEKLRFDFSHGKSMSDDEIIRVEKLVSESIARTLPVYAEVAPQEKALKIHGLRAVFGEKYPPMVRVVSVGAPVAELLGDSANTKWRQYSVEFCGGTHLKNAGDVEDFVITGEESVSKGIRRIIGLTGEHARKSISAEREVEAAISKAQSAPEAELPAINAALQKQLGTEGLPLRAKRRGQAAIAELQKKHRTWEKSQQKSGGASIDIASVAADLLGKGSLVVAAIDGASDDQLRSLMDSIKKRSPSFAAMLATSDGQKVSFVSAVSDDLIAKGLKAGDWIRETAKVAGGGGGGSPKMAQAGGKDPSKLNDALELARKYASERI